MHRIDTAAIPIESSGFDTKISGGDMDPKTYSPMSGSDENMSSPPSVLTTASAGSCTPSSLPSAGSTPSSIPSAGSTPYQFVSQEESTVIKPLTPSDHQSLPPSTPDQPITPEPAMTHCLVSELQTGSNTEMDQCKKSIFSGLDHSTTITTANTNCLLRGPSCTSPGISDDVNEKREDCPCLICSEKQHTSLQSLSCKDTKDSAESEKNVVSYPSVQSDSTSAETNNKPKLPKFKASSSTNNNNSNTAVKSRRKSTKSKAVLYQSEISGDPESTSIKIRIKLTPTGSSKKKSDVVASPSFKSSSEKRQSQSRTKSRKRNLSPTKNVPNSVTATPSRSKKKKKVPPFTGWGQPLREVDGEPQSVWAYSIPVHILEKIFHYTTYCDDCIPFLHR